MISQSTLRMYMLFPIIKEKTSDQDLDTRKKMYKVLREAIQQRRLLGMKTDNVDEMLYYRFAFRFEPELVSYFYRVLAIAEDTYNNYNTPSHYFEQCFEQLQNCFRHFKICA